MKEKDIVDSLVKKDEKAIDELLLYYEPLMRYIISPILQLEQDREDCLSEVTMKIWEKIDSFDPERGSFKAWITAIARNTALNHKRKSPQENSLEDIKECVPSSAPTPEETVIQNECKRELEKALNTLPSKDKTLFYRKYYYLQSTSQIASELGMTERAVEGKLYRLKKQLRKTLGGERHE